MDKRDEKIDSLKGDLVGSIDARNLELENIFPFDFQYIDTNKMLEGYWSIEGGVPTVISNSGYWCISIKSLPSGKYSSQTFAEWQSYIRRLDTNEFISFHDLGFTPSNSVHTIDINYPFDLYMTTRSKNSVVWYKGEHFISGRSSEYGGHNVGTPKVFYCGKNRKYSKLKDAIEAAEEYMDSVLYVDAGTYDLIQEFSDEYFTNFDGSGHYIDGAWGIVLKNRIHIIFAENAKVICNYQGNNSAVCTYFSAFNSGRYGFTLENANIETSNIRYSIHDDRGDADEEGYKNIYKRCRVIHNPLNGYENALGGGFGNNGDIVIEDCYFKSEGIDYPLYYHNSAHGGTNYRAHCVFKNNYIMGGVKFNSKGDSTLVTDVYVSNNSFSKGLVNATPEGKPKNVDVYYWNNVMRSN